ncbi:cyclic AMP-responsive element-binding protein 1-like isoform 1-T2 [Synchiropus picturatus]
MENKPNPQSGQIQYYSLHTVPGEHHPQFQYECPQNLQLMTMINVPTAEPLQHVLQYNNEVMDGLPMFSSDAVQASSGDMAAYHPLHRAAPTHQQTVVQGNTSSTSSPRQGFSQKRAQRLMSNRKAARECRQRKKEYLKQLEERAAELDGQNKLLLEEIKELKSIYGHNDD